MLLIDVGARGGFHPRWDNVVDERIGIDADRDAGRRTLALADEPGTRPFHVLRARPCSSLYRPNDAYLARFPGALDRFTIDEVRTIETTTLDRVAPPGGDVVLKLDVEGAERAVLAGATQTLTRTVLIETEVWFAPVFTGGVVFHELHGELLARGFSLVTLRRCWWRDARDVPHLVTGDAVYVRADHQDARRLLAAYRSRRSRLRAALSAARHAGQDRPWRLLDGDLDSQGDVDW